MRIAGLVRQTMMQTMCGYPEYRATFQCHGGKNGEQIFNPLGCFIRAMRQQAVITHADTHSAGKPPQNCAERDSLPAEEKQRENGTDMKGSHKEDSDPVGCFDFLNDICKHSLILNRVDRSVTVKPRCRVKRQDSNA